METVKENDINNDFESSVNEPDLERSTHSVDVRKIRVAYGTVSASNGGVRRKCLFPTLFTVVLH